MNVVWQGGEFKHKAGHARLRICRAVKNNAELLQPRLFLSAIFTSLHNSYKRDLENDILLHD